MLSLSHPKDFSPRYHEKPSQSVPAITLSIPPAGKKALFRFERADLRRETERKRLVRKKPEQRQPE